jgi:prolyl-tRNA synthetase
MYQQAKEFMAAHTGEVTTMAELEAGVQTGFVKAAWCGEQGCEDEIKEKFNASSRNMPFDQPDMTGEKCVCCGKEAKKLIYFAKAY